MAVLSKNLILSLSAIALLAACDDNDSSTSTSLVDWFKANGQSTASIYVPQRDYVTETQAGNYLAGQFAQYRQDWATANKYLDRVIALDPSNMELQQRSMVLSIQAGDANRAIAMARKVLEKDKQNVLGLLVISMDQIARQDYSEAHHTLEKMPANGVSDFIRPILLAWVKTPDGASDDEDLINTSPLHAYHALLISDYLGYVKDANRYFVNILASGEVDSHIMEKVGDIFARHNNPDMAKKIYETIMKHKVANTVFPGELKDLQAKIDDPKPVLTGKITTPAQGAAEAFHNMASILYHDGNDDSALVFARISENLAADSEDNKLMIAGIMMRNGHTDAAIDILKTIKSDSPTFLNAQRSAAELMEQDNRLDESVAYLEKIYAEHKDISALIQVGDAYRRAEKHGEAIKAYDRAEASLGGPVTADYWQLLYARGMSYERFGNMTRAEADLEKAIEFKPDHPYLLNYLGYSWADQGKHMDKAMELITKAASLRPDDGYITDSLGWVYYKIGDYANAVKELEKAVELVPFDPTINDHLGDAYWKIGRKQEARFQWQRAINHNDKNELKTATLEDKIENGLSDAKPPVQQAKKEAASDTAATAKP